MIVAAASWLLTGRLSSANVATPTTSPVGVSDTPIPQIPVTFGTTANLHFQDGSALLDRVALVAEVMPAPPADSQYEVWLVNEQDRLPLGILYVDENGKGQLSFDDPQDRNLLANYQQVEITIEPDTNLDSNGSTGLAYSYALPEGGIPYLRGLMVSLPGIPGEGGLIHGLAGSVNLIYEAGREMLSNYQNGNQVGTKENAESIINLLVGAQSPDHKDWNGNGQTTDPGDGYGLFLNGNNLGYIQAVYSYADYAVNSPAASRNMILNGENVKVCSENLARWAPELRNQLSTILNTTQLSEVSQEIQRSAELTDQLLNGVDKNENGDIEPIAEECGVLVAYEATYLMADMPLLPVMINPQGTAIAISETVIPSQTATPSSPFLVTLTKQQSGGPATLAPTNQPPAPTSNQPKATKKPKPTQNPGSGPNPKPTKKH